LLVPRATLVTPNADEAALFAGFPVTDEASMVRAGEALLRAGAGAVLVKGGHVEGTMVIDVLLEREGKKHVFRAERISSRSTHGTGCTLATAIAASLGRGLDLEHSIARARELVREAMSAELDIGEGHAPLNHVAATRSPSY
jgi:hydroxymethylpyrimidine/phosphomethylpyrimidine kinase